MPSQDAAVCIGFPLDITAAFVKSPWPDLTVPSSLMNRCCPHRRDQNLAVQQRVPCDVPWRWTDPGRRTFRLGCKLRGVCETAARSPSATTLPIIEHLREVESRIACFRCSEVPVSGVELRGLWKAPRPPPEFSTFRSEQGAV